jgi:hypothetical protein
MSDNTFATAKYIGSFGSSGGSVIAKGKINSADPVDIYRLNLRAGSAFNARSSFSIQGGSLDYSVYFKNPATNQITFFQKLTLSPDSVTITVPFVSSSIPVTTYLKFDRPATQNVKYSLSYTSLFS